MQQKYIMKERTEALGRHYETENQGRRKFMKGRADVQRRHEM